MFHSEKKEKQRPNSSLVKAYWAANVKLLIKLLIIWFLVSFGAGIIFVDTLNQLNFMGMPLGFWFAQQGSIFVFVLLIFIYARQMKKMEKIFGISDEDEIDSYDIDESQGGNS